MDVRDMFLDQHAAMHSAAVGGNKMSASERTFANLSDEQMRVRPREDLNSLAWLMWHIARAEDIFINTILGARTQLLDDEGWAKRLAVTRRDFGIGMTSAEVTELTRQIELGALREYRDAVVAARARWSEASDLKIGRAPSRSTPSSAPPIRARSACEPSRS